MGFVGSFPASPDLGLCACGGRTGKDRPGQYHPPLAVLQHSRAGTAPLVRGDRQVGSVADRPAGRVGVLDGMEDPFRFQCPVLIGVPAGRVGRAGTAVIPSLADGHPVHLGCADRHRDYRPLRSRQPAHLLVLLSVWACGSVAVVCCQRDLRSLDRAPSERKLRARRDPCRGAVFSTLGVFPSQRTSAGGGPLRGNRDLLRFGRCWRNPSVRGQGRRKRPGVERPVDPCFAVSTGWCTAHRAR